MRVDLALLANLVEKHLCGDFAFFMGRLHYNGYGRGRDFGPFGVVEAQEAHAVGHERVEVLAGAVDVRQGPAVGGEDSVGVSPSICSARNALSALGQRGRFRE